MLIIFNKLEFGGQGLRPMPAGAVWYRYTTEHGSVSLPSTVGGYVHIAPFVNVTNSPKI